MSVSKRLYYQNNKVPEEVGRKISESNKGRVFSAEHKKKLSESHKGISPSQQTIDKTRLANTGKVRTYEQKQKMLDFWKENPRPSKVILKIDRKTGTILDEYISAKEASELNNINYSTLRNATTDYNRIAGGFKWKYKEDCDKQNNVEECLNHINKHETI